jgi:hypothetical protein
VGVGSLVGVPDEVASASGDTLGDADGARTAVGRGEGDAVAGRLPVAGAGDEPHAATATDTTTASRRRRTDAPSTTRRL